MVLGIFKIALHLRDWHAFMWQSLKILNNLKVVSATFLLVFFCMSKREQLQNKEKYFLFHFKSSSCSWRAFNILDIQMSWYHQMPKHETQNILLNNLGSKHSLVMKFDQFMQYYKIIFFIKKFCKKSGLETSSRPFLIFKESSVKKIL